MTNQEIQKALFKPNENANIEANWRLVFNANCTKEVVNSFFEWMEQLKKSGKVGNGSIDIISNSLIQLPLDKYPREVYKIEVIKELHVDDIG